MKIVIESLNVKRGGKLVINNLNAEMSGPGLYQIIGPNGVGKTTLLLTILGFIKPESGKVVVHPPSSGGGFLFAYMPQSYNIPRESPMTVLEFVEGLHMLKKPWPRTFRRLTLDLNKVQEILEKLEVPRNLWNEKLRNLSGGLLQRVFLARTILADSPILLLDEPFSNIDPQGKVGVADFIGELSKKKLIVVTSHDPILLLNYTKRILLMGYGYYVYGDVDEVLRHEVLHKFYAKCAMEIERHVHIVDWH